MRTDQNLEKDPQKDPQRTHKGPTNGKGVTNSALWPTEGCSQFRPPVLLSVTSPPLLSDPARPATLHQTSDGMHTHYGRANDSGEVQMTTNGLTTGASSWTK